VRHAAATEVRIGLSVDVAATSFALTIEDNGRGFDPKSSAMSEPDRIAAGHGLKNILDRLEEIGGRCEMASEPGKGTRTSLIVRLGAEL
jgi:signal transduction histidine kinase